MPTQHVFQLTLGATAIVVGMACRGEGADAARLENQIVIQSNANFNVAQQVGRIETETTVSYLWIDTNGEKALKLSSLRLDMIENGVTTESFYQDREKARILKGGRLKEINTADAPPPVQAMHRDCFEAELARIQFTDGKETSRKIVAGPGAKTLLDGGIIDNASIFHPQFRTDVNRWTRETVLPTGLGSAAKGTLTYERIPETRADVAKVRVSGTLQADDVGIATTRMNLTYVTKGEQLYDLTQQAWTAGQLDLEMSGNVREGATVVGKFSGTMHLRLVTEAVQPSAPANLDN